MASSHKKMSGRDKESLVIQMADKSVAVGRLMKGQIETWEEYLKPDTTDYASLPRRQLKSGFTDVKKRLSKDIEDFYSRNFVGLKDKAISALYDDIKAQRGIEMPLTEFENKYGKVKLTVLKGNPAHLTVSISLWGLKFLFPEDLLSKDIVVALEILKESSEAVGKYELQSHRSVQGKTDEFLQFIRRAEFAQRSLVLCCFNLMEAYLNGLAWDYCQSNNLENLSKRKAKLLTDTSTASIREKITKYPTIISGCDNVELAESEEFLEIIKPFRDSLVHPSPFSAPQKFGGYHKLKKLYELDKEVAVHSAEITISLIKDINRLVKGTESPPIWCNQVEDTLGVIRNCTRAGSQEQSQV